MAEAAYLNAIPSALVAIDRTLTVRYINQAAEALFGISAQHAIGRVIDTFPALSERLCSLCETVFSHGESISLFEETLRLPLNHRTVNMHITPVFSETPGKSMSVSEVIISVEKADGLDRMAASKWKQETTRAAGVMAAMLAHEVKNPLSGIRGAAQLLRDEVVAEQQPLTDLICMETDRINDLLSQVEVFADGAPETVPVNIHEVLQYVISIAQTGFAPHVNFKEKYDPSLPMVMGHRDLLVQMFLNLVKNAAEAMQGLQGAGITITTTYRSGYRIRSDTSQETISLPVMVTVEDNGSGIPEDIRAHLFEPFVSSKEDGRGLGLAVVAKIASDLGAVVELDQTYENGTKFIIWLACQS